MWQERPLAFACAGDPLTAQYPHADNDIHAVAAVMSGGRVVLAAGGDEQGCAFWDLDSGELIRGARFDDPYLAAITEVRGEGPPLFVTATQYAEEILVWGPSAEAPLELVNELGRIACLTASHSLGFLLAAAGGMDEGVAVWDLTAGEEVRMFDTDEKRVLAVSLTRLTGDPILVAGVEDEIQVWGLTDEHGDDPIRDPLTGHEDAVEAMDTAVVGERALAVSGGADATVRLWDLTTGTQLGDPLIGHKGRVDTVRTAILKGRHVALSAGRDGRINLWDLETLAQ
ncbi:WD40 repeat domain-containing protein [Nonomuraea bangladeshensis]|uniref:WD40 repeat domain-containing protein n=1 Tax=Nonomuraea bangladeshensis TaxID=404385 RepID=UPI003C300DBF